MRAPISPHPAPHRGNTDSVDDLSRRLAAVTLGDGGSSGDGLHANGCAAPAATGDASAQLGAGPSEYSFSEGSQAGEDGGWEGESEEDSGYETGLDPARETASGHYDTPHTSRSRKQESSPASSSGEDSALGSTSGSDTQGPPGAASRGEAVWELSDDSNSCGDAQESGEGSVIEVNGDSPAAGERPVAPPPPSAGPTSADASVLGTPALSKVAFRRRQAQLARDTFAAFNRRVFEGALPTDLPIRWSKRLRNTGGRCFMRRRPLATAGSRHAPGTARDGAWEYQAEIELATHVVDEVHRLEHVRCSQLRRAPPTEPLTPTPIPPQVLLHEMCHAAAWLVHHVHKPPHGKHFKCVRRRGRAPGLMCRPC